MVTQPLIAPPRSCGHSVNDCRSRVPLPRPTLPPVLPRPTGMLGEIPAGCALGPARVWGGMGGRWGAEGGEGGRGERSRLWPDMAVQISEDGAGDDDIGRTDLAWGDGLPLEVDE